jgi:hemerythrin-like domain-containing protein
MSEQQTFQKITQATIEEHKQIDFYLDQVSVTLDSLREEDTDVEPMRRLAAQIEGLKERLVEHHQTEEEGGLFQAILDVMPESRVEVSRLANQHEKIIEILELARIHALQGEPPEAAALREDLNSFLEMFRDHECQEEQLFKRALEREHRAPAD